MIEVIDVDENHNIDKFNAAAKRAHDNPDTHGLLVKIYADWCGHCQNMKAELKKNYRCKKPGCVLTIANIRLANVEPNDPVLNSIKYIPKDIQGVPLIMYVSKGTRGLEYSKNRVYAEMLKWVVSNPDFALSRRGAQPKATDNKQVLLGLTKKAQTKFKHFHRATLKQFHKEMKHKHNKSVHSRIPTPFPYTKKTGRHIPAYLR
jgi:thiol-disulfide isomerase/thioredoxin